MRIKFTSSGARALAMAVCLLIPAASAAQTKTQSERASRGGSGGTVIFAVSKYEGGEVHIEPAVVVNRGRYAQPPLAALLTKPTPQAERNEKRFIADYFRPGRQYRLLFGGGEAGSLNVKAYLDPGCTGMVASATLQSQARLGGEVMALATDSASLGGEKSTRRAPTEKERAAAVELARAALRGKRVVASRIAKMETNNLTAIDLDGDGRAELIGSFVVKGDVGVQNALFLIAEPRGERFNTALSWYHLGEEATTQYRRLVDALDLDGDGTAEVIAEGLYYESNDYMIYKKARGTWRVVYQGGGGGC